MWLGRSGEHTVVYKKRSLNLSYRKICPCFVAQFGDLKTHIFHRSSALCRSHLQLCRSLTETLHLLPVTDTTEQRHAGVFHFPQRHTVCSALHIWTIDLISKFSPANPSNYIQYYSHFDGSQPQWVTGSKNISFNEHPHITSTDTMTRLCRSEMANILQL